MLSIIILTHNEEQMLPDCLKSVAWADEIVVVDKRSTDRSVEIAKQAGAKVIPFNGTHFDEWRTMAMYHASHDWILYIDPDERVTEELRTEIQRLLNPPAADAPAPPASSAGQAIDEGGRDPLSSQERVRVRSSAFRMPRRNVWWGKEFKHCGAWPDYVTRLFDKSKLREWKGIIHESPVIEGDVGTLNAPLLHYTHRDLVSGLQKSYQWTRLEAELFVKAGHPPVTWWRLAKVTQQEFFRKYVIQKGFLEGMEGFIESAVQAWNRFMVYEQLWEIQRNKDSRKMGVSTSVIPDLANAKIGNPGK